MNAQLDVPPLTLSLSPEYEGEGTKTGPSARPGRHPPALKTYQVFWVVRTRPVDGTFVHTLTRLTTAVGPPKPAAEMMLR
jgi:hypothetical protein